MSRPRVVNRGSSVETQANARVSSDFKGLRVAFRDGGSGELCMMRNMRFELINIFNISPDLNGYWRITVYFQ
jgi:hypothetical protein